jgi:hypothetical protein
MMMQIYNKMNKHVKMFCHEMAFPLIEVLMKQEIHIN